MCIIILIIMFHTTSIQDMGNESCHVTIAGLAGSLWVHVGVSQ